MSAATSQRADQRAYCAGCAGPVSGGESVCASCSAVTERRRVAAAELRAWKRYDAGSFR